MKKSVKKTVIRIILAVLALLIAVIIVWGGLMFVPYSHYKKAKEARNIEYTAENLSSICVMSCNVRCLNPTDLGKKSWFNRAELVLNGIESQKPSIIGFQEATKWQYSYLCDTLPQYDSVITYRDKAFNSEGCPVFYRKDIYNLIDKGSFWLSETPNEMSKDWGAACYRICTYVILEDIETAKQFVIFNTHLDHISDEARINGIGVVLDKIKEFGSLPSLIMGDFNSEEGSETYKAVTENFLDAKYQTENTMTSATYQNFGKELDRNCIDYFMISKEGFTVNSYKVLTDTYDGVYSSDHFPIVTNLTLN